MLKIHQILFFASIFTIKVLIFVKAQMDSEDVRSQNQFDSDVTHDLTDNDVKMALNDLSLKDLKSLQTFIDSADYNDLNLHENGFADKNFASYDFDSQEFDRINDNPDDYDYNLEDKDSSNELFDNPKSQRNYHIFRQESQRAKRHDQELNPTDEYIKQLVYSFPQNEQLSYKNIEGEKSLIRVKRN